MGLSGSIRVFGSNASVCFGILTNDVKNWFGEGAKTWLVLDCLLTYYASKPRDGIVCASRSRAFSVRTELVSWWQQRTCNAGIFISTLMTERPRLSDRGLLLMLSVWNRLSLVLSSNGSTLNSRHCCHVSVRKFDKVTGVIWLWRFHQCQRRSKRSSSKNNVINSSNVVHIHAVILQAGFRYLWWHEESSTVNETVSYPQTSVHMVVRSRQILTIIEDCRLPQLADIVPRSQGTTPTSGP